MKKVAGFAYVFCFSLVLMLMSSCRTNRCEEGKEKLYLTVAYEILNADDCGISGLVKNGEFFLEINAEKSDSLFVAPLNGTAGSKYFLKTNIEYKGTENISFRLLDKNLFTKFVANLDNVLKGYYKYFDGYASILKVVPMVKDLMKDYTECGAGLVKIKKPYCEKNAKTLIITNTELKEKVKLRIYYTCR